MRTTANYQRLAALVCAAALLLCLLPCAQAAEPSLTAGVASCTEGSTCTVYITATELEQLSALELTVFYDADALTLSSAVGAAALDVSSINTSTAGVIRMTAATSAKDGISGSLTVLTLRFQAKEGASGTYPIQLAIDSALDTGRNTLTLSLRSGSVTITEKSEGTQSLPYYLSASPAKLHQGDTLLLNVVLSASRDLQAGNFAFSYDPEVLSFQSITPSSAAQSGVWSINNKNRGYVLFSWAGDTPLNSGQLLCSAWTVLADTNASTSISVHPFELYSKNHASLSASDRTQSLTLQHTSEEPAAPALYLSVPDDVRATQSFTATLWAEAGTGLAAADLAIKFDPEILQCTDVRRAKQAEEAGISVVCAVPGTTGTQTLSLLRAEGFTQAVALAELDFTALKQTTKASLTLSQRTTSVDKDGHALTLRFRPAELSVLSEFLTVTFLDADGKLIESHPVRIGSDASAPTAPMRLGTKDVCWHFSGWSGSLKNVTEDRTLTAQYTSGAHGSYQYEKSDTHTHTRMCGICGYSEGEAHVLSADTCTLCGEVFDHDLKPVSKQDESCDADGKMAHYKCSRCNALFEDAGGKKPTTDAALTIPASHKWADATCTAPKTCSACGVTEGSALGHDFTDNAEFCKRNCGAENPNYDPCANGHSFTKYVSNNDATCTTDGTKTATCDNCDETDRVADKGSALGHDFSNNAEFCKRNCGAENPNYDPCKNGHSFTKYVSNSDATCTADGTKTATCDNCDETDTVTDVGSKGHDLKPLSKEEERSDADGKVAHYKCARCSALFEDAEGKTQIIPVRALGDIDGNGKIEAADAILVLKHLVGLLTLDEEQCAAADVDGSGKLTTIDAVYILRFAADLIQKFPVDS